MFGGGPNPPPPSWPQMKRPSPTNHPTPSAAAVWQREVLHVPRRGARNGSKVGPPPAALIKRSRGARLPLAQSAGGELWEGFLRWCLPNVQAHIRRPGAFDATAPPETLESRAAWRRRHHRNPCAPYRKGTRGSSPPQRAPPPGSHLREIQVGDARKCPRDSTALPLRAPTCAGARLGAAKKGAVMQQAKTHCLCTSGCVQ